MKKLFIIPIRETNILPNNYLYCKVYKDQEVNNFNIKKDYLEDCEWLLELSTEDINEYVLFYYSYINKQLDRHPKLQGNDYREVDIALDTLTLLMGIKYHLNYLDWNTLNDKFLNPLSERLKDYAISTGDKSLLENLDFSTSYIRYWYNFNNYTTCK